MKVLITFTGFNDPYGKTVVEGEERAGPILSLLSVGSSIMFSFYPRRELQN